MDLRNRVVLITGGKRIGQVVASELAARGADIGLAYRGSRQEAEQAAADVRAQGRRAALFQADVSRAAENQIGDKRRSFQVKRAFPKP